MRFIHYLIYSFHFRINSRRQRLEYSTSIRDINVSAETLNLSLATDIKWDDTKFSIVFEDKELKFRTDSKLEAAKWVEGLHQWKDYFILKHI